MNFQNLVEFCLASDNKNRFLSDINYDCPSAAMHEKIKYKNNILKAASIFSSGCFGKQRCCQALSFNNPPSPKKPDKERPPYARQSKSAL